MSIQYWGDVITTAGTLLSSIYIYKKSTNCIFEAKKMILTVPWCIIWALLRAFNPAWMPPFIVYIIACVACIVFIWRLFGHRFETALSAYLLSYGISYSLLAISTVAVSLAFIPFWGSKYVDDTSVDFNSPDFLLLAIFVASLQLLLAYLLFKIRRFKNGFSFLFERYAVVVALIAAGAVLTFNSLVLNNNVNNIAFFSLISGVIIIGVGIYIWIRRGIKLFYCKKMKERGIELLEQELAEKEHEIQRLTEQNDVMRVANHKITHRLAALERSVIGLAEKIQSNNSTMKISEELSVTLEDIKRLSREYQDGIDKVNGKKPLPSTKIKILDDLFGYFSEQCAKKKHRLSSQSEWQHPIHDRACGSAKQAGNNDRRPSARRADCGKRKRSSVPKHFDSDRAC